MRLRPAAVLLAMIFSQSLFAQTDSVPVAIINNLEHKAWICIDSTGRKTSTCSLGLDALTIEFYKVFFNRETKELRLIGRIPTIAYVGIFLGTKDSLPLKAPISRTSYDKEYISNDGFFDVRLKVDAETVLYFYERQYFARQFNVFHLLWGKVNHGNSRRQTIPLVIKNLTAVTSDIF